jgi:hypothetical protein
VDDSQFFATSQKIEKNKNPPVDHKKKKRNLK